jgi:hypothetical protein
MPDVRTIIQGLNGSERSGMCLCPCHDDNSPSLHVSAGYKQPVVLYCHAGCTFEQVRTKLREMGLWDATTHSDVAPQRAKVHRTDEERRQYARLILHSTRRNDGAERAPLLLPEYFAKRGLVTVPPTALIAMPVAYVDDIDILIPDKPAMIFAVTDGNRIVGAHVTWLSWDLNDKADDKPPRQTYGPIAGGYIKLYRGELDLAQPLLIAEGVEKAWAAAQITGLPAISALSANNMPKIIPPRVNEYIIAADNDLDGCGQRAARALAVKLVRAGHTVRVAIPPVPGLDWDDLLPRGAS